MDYSLMMKLAAHIVAVVNAWEAGQGMLNNPFEFFRFPVVNTSDRVVWVYMRFNAKGYDRIQVQDPTGTYASNTWADFCTLDLALCG